jgi:hypothetical protein
VIAGEGALKAMASAPSGTVIAVFARAAYVRFPAGVLAVTAPSLPRGPLYLSGAGDPSALRVGGTWAAPDRWSDRPAVETVTLWQGELPTHFAIDLELLAPVARRSALLAPPLASRWRAATEQRDLAGACHILGGLGPGLTPSGDDALAGMLLAARVRWPGTEDHLVALAKTVATHEISRAFFEWAARGQSIEPVHRLLAGDATAAHDLDAFGHTSGADLALGLLFGLRAPWRERLGSAPLGGG